jgi:two-component system, NarL family, nitrate/nitrite response regulator NarL
MPSPKAIAKPEAIKVLVADDDPLVRAAVNLLLDEKHGHKLIGEATDGFEAVSLARSLHPDILLLDLNMPKKPGLEALRELAEERPAMKVIVLTLAIERRQILEALQLGACGIVLKAAARYVLGDSVAAVMAGKYWIKDQPRDDVQQIIHELSMSVTPGKPEHAPKLGLLNSKEIQIVTYIVEGRTNRDIASTMQTSEQVVKNHLGKIFDKLGVFNRLELALYALDNRLVERH